MPRAKCSLQMTTATRAICVPRFKASALFGVCRALETPNLRGALLVQLANIAKDSLPIACSVSESKTCKDGQTGNMGNQRQL